jgi:diguanylate cyclase (GGDEF)-like protein
MSAQTQQVGPTGDLASLLAAATTVTDAADVTVSYLDDRGLPLPSVYLEQGGRLRCYAQRGYWQVLDGIPCDLGVIGRTFRTGRTVEVSDARQEEQFLFAAPDLRQQISVPIRYARHVAGTLNVESDSPLPTGTRHLLEEAAAAFEDRLAELGGPPAESIAQLVARLATAMTELDREPDIRRTVLDAAIQVAGMPTAAIVEPDEDGRARVVSASGPLRGALEAVDRVDLGRLDDLVTAGTSLFANGTAASDLDVHGRLRTAGVAALAVVPLTASGDHLGSLVVVSETPHAFEPVVLPSLEILAAQAAASIRAARTVAELRRRARQDPLTGLGHHATFQEELRTRLAHRPAGRQLAVLMIDVDDFKAVNDRHGHQAGDLVLKQLGARLSSALRSDDRLYRVGGDEFATIIEVREVQEAADIARRMIEVARQGPATISVGLAVATAEESATDLLHRADTAMYAAKGSGRDSAGVAPAPVTAPDAADVADG